MSLVYILGMAGSGKTTLTAKFSEWLEKNGEIVKRANLDPGVVQLPYKPDFDVREIVNLQELMRREGLGPNGGLLRANEIMLQNINVISSRINELSKNASYILIDTPGQLELFAFRELGSKVISSLSSLNSVGIFLIDALNLVRASDVVMAVLLTLAIRFHLDIDVVMIINKIDTTDQKPVYLLRQFFANPKVFMEEITRENGGIIGEMTMQLVDVLREFLPPSRIVAISALKMDNLDDLFSIIHDVFCGCGDLM